jgi:hypothetical protein
MKNKMLKLFSSLLVMCFISTMTVYGSTVDSGPESFNLSIPATVAIDLELVTAFQSNNLVNVFVLDSAITVEVDSQASAGFTMSVASTNSGEFRHTSYAAQKSGTYIDYAMRITETSGTLGGSWASTLPSEHDLGSSTLSLILVSPTSATQDYLFSIDIKVDAPVGGNTHLLGGTYMESITVTITSN